MKRTERGAITIYECENGHIFDEPEAAEQDVGFSTEIGWRSVYERYDVCPCCGTTEISEYEEQEDTEE